MPEDVIHYPYTASQPIVGGRVVSRIPTAIAAGPATFTIQPKVNQQAPSGVLRDKYTDRFDHPYYYSYPSG